MIDQYTYHLNAERRRLERRMIDLGLVGAHVTRGEEAGLVQVYIEDLDLLIRLAEKGRG